MSKKQPQLKDKIIGYSGLVLIFSLVFYAISIKIYTYFEPVEFVSPQPIFAAGPNTIQSNLPQDSLGEITSTGPAISPTPTPVMSKEEIDLYMKYIFGKDYKVAHAVAMVEGYPKTEVPDWGRSFCWHKVEDGKHKGEYSVGIFQINIVQGCEGEGALVHWKRIPGETLEEKKEWLSYPKNNILFARMLQLEHDGFSPWTGYTSGNYLKYMK